MCKESFEITSKVKLRLIPQSSRSHRQINVRVQQSSAQVACGLPTITTMQALLKFQRVRNRKGFLHIVIFSSLFSFLVNDHKRKQKVLGPNQKLKFNPTELIIYCKDFRIVRFRFDESGPESAKKVIRFSG